MKTQKNVNYIRKNNTIRRGQGVGYGQREFIKRNNIIDYNDRNMLKT